MKKHQLLLAALLLMLVCPSAFGQTFQKLDSRVLEDWDESYFNYNDRGLIDSTYLLVNAYDEIQCYKKYTYDERGLCVRQDDYQLVDGLFRHICYIEYTYNDDKQMIKRYNYNSQDGKKFNVGGELIWTYNEDGSIATIKTSMPHWGNPEQWDLYAIEYYKYNDDKTLNSIEIQTVPFDGGIEDIYVSSTADYKYNGKKQLVEDVHKYYYEGGGSEPASTTKSTYLYDEVGNLIEYDSYPTMYSKMPELRYIYHYDLDTPAEQVIYPFNYEEKQLAIYLTAASISPNRISSEEWWQIPVDAIEDKLDHVGDYVLTYSDFEASGIENTFADNNNSLSFCIDGSRLFFTSLKEGAMIKIYDLNGSMVMQQAYNAGGISIEGLARGGYICKVANYRLPVKFIR